MKFTPAREDHEDSEAVERDRAVILHISYATMQRVLHLLPSD